MFRNAIRAAAFAAAALVAFAAQAQNIRIAYIDPLSGSFANVGEAGLKHYQAMAEDINARGGLLGRKVEIVPFDNKVSPQEALNQLKRVIDQGIRFITQGNSSAVAGALTQELVDLATILYALRALGGPPSGFGGPSRPARAGTGSVGARGGAH